MVDQVEELEYAPSYPAGNDEALVAYPSGKKAGKEQVLDQQEELPLEPIPTPEPYPEESPEESPEQNGAYEVDKEDGCPEKSAEAGVGGEKFIIQVGANGLTFEPKDLQVPLGATVEWQFAGGTHNVKQVADAVTCDAMADGFTTPENMSSGSFTQVMDKPGKTWFACTVGQHCQSGMRGLITVSEGSGATAPTNSDPPADTGAPVDTAAPVVPADPASSQAQSSEQQSEPQEWTVNVGEGGLKFSPDTLTINQGDTVNFVFVSGTHNVVETADATTCAPKAGGFASEALSSGNFQQTFDTVGTQWYVCTVGSHCEGGMKAKIVVEEKGSVAAPTSNFGLKSAYPVWTGIMAGLVGVALIL
jgi:plastocyanin